MLLLTGCTWTSVRCRKDFRASDAVVLKVWGSDVTTVSCTTSRNVELEKTRGQRHQRGGSSDSTTYIPLTLIPEEERCCRTSLSPSLPPAPRPRAPPRAGGAPGARRQVKVRKTSLGVGCGAWRGDRLGAGAGGCGGGSPTQRRGKKGEFLWFFEALLGRMAWGQVEGAPVLWSLHGGGNCPQV